MTEERFNEIVRSPNWDYELGRETAKDRIANGTYRKYQNYPLEQVMGDAWSRGFRDYVKAWEIIHNEEL